MIVEFSVNGNEYSVFHDIVPVIQFISSRGAVGKSGGVFRVASGQKKNFIMAISSMIYMAQVSFPKKECFFRFYDTNQNPAYLKNTVVPYPLKTAASANSSPGDLIPSSFSTISSFDRQLPRSITHPVKRSLTSTRQKTRELISLSERRGTVFERETIKKTLMHKDSGLLRSQTHKPQRRQHAVSEPVTMNRKREDPLLESGDLLNCWNRLEALASLAETENDS